MSQDTIGYIQGFAAVYLFLISFILETRNLPSTLVFKLGPFLIGFASSLVSLKAFNII